jgi:hypothetical protein
VLRRNTSAFVAPLPCPLSGQPYFACPLSGQPAACSNPPLATGPSLAPYRSVRERQKFIREPSEVPLSRRDAAVPRSVVEVTVPETVFVRQVPRGRLHSGSLEMTLRCPMDIDWSPVGIGIVRGVEGR